MNKYADEPLDDLMDRYVFGLMSARSAARVRRRVTDDPEWQLAYEAALARHRALSETFKDDTESAPAVSTVRQAAEWRDRQVRRRHRRIRLVSGGIAAAALLAIAVGWLRYALVPQPRWTIRVVGQQALMAGSTAALRTLVTDTAGRPQADVPVSLSLQGADGRRVHLATWTSGPDGDAAGHVTVPDWAAGDYTLIAATGRRHAQALEVPISITRAARVYLATDKPLYQPGQTIHMRCLALSKPALTPMAGETAAFIVTDPPGNIIFTQPVDLSDFGLGWTDLPLDDLIMPGRYTIKAAVGSDAAEQTVEVFHYKLPAFAVRVDLDRPYYLPGETVRGTLSARYHFGKPVSAGQAHITLTGRPAGAEDLLRTVDTETDTAGAATFAIGLPETLFGSEATQGDAHLRLAVTVTDGAGQQNTAYRTVVAARQAIRVVAVPENGTLAPRLENRIYVVTSYPDGRPAEAIVDVPVLGTSIRTNAAGVAILPVKGIPKRLDLSARDAAGRTGEVEMDVEGARGPFILRTDRPIYTAGETLKAEIVAAADTDVFLDVVKDRQTVLTKTLTVQNGRAAIAIDLSPHFAGTLHLHAYRLDDEGEWVGRDVLVIVRPAAGLRVAVETDRDVYRPGEDATLAFRATDAQGGSRPAALSLAAVDEAVYSLEQAQPGLEATLAGLDEELLRPAIEVHCFSPSLMARDPAYARAALAAAIPHRDPAAEKLRRLEDQYLINLDLIRQEGPAGIRRMLDRQPWLAETLDAGLIDALTTGPYPHTLDWDNRADAVAAYTRRRSNAKEAAGAITVIGLVIGLVALIAAAAAVMPPSRPGEPGVLVTTLVVILLLLFLVMILLPSLARAREAARSVGVANDLRNLSLAVMQDEYYRDARSGEASASGASVRVRTYFPETMLWRPQVITDETGRATLTVPLADSITTWRLTGSAVSRSGDLGTVNGSIRVFQPFFADIDAPLDLTQGDEIAVPVIVYNYTDRPLDVALSAQGSPALSVLAGASQTVGVEPDEVTRAFVRVRAEAIGEGTLTLQASAGDVADAIRRTIRIAPKGFGRTAAVNGSLTDGAQTVEVTIPDDAVPGSVAVQLKVYPSTFSELLDGLENIFRMPFGCFEQTSSITYPNVMALAYMQANGIGAPEVRATATRYINLGYQRLLSFEVSGGGFDWFGRPPANTVLTAYGLMEFVDMAKVHAVDSRVIQRTAEWLTSKQQVDGAWQFESGIFHEAGVGTDDLAVTAYVTWALAMHDPTSTTVQKGVAFIERHLAGAAAAHTLALCANALLTANPHNSAGIGAARQLARTAKRDGNQCHWPVTQGTLTYSRGGLGDVETTALAVLALARQPEHARLVHDALRWIVATRDPYGTWCSTHATVLALKALLAGASAPAARPRPAGVTVTDAEGALLGRLTIEPQQSTAVHTIRLAGLDAPGTHRLVLSAREADGMPFQAVARYHTETPPPAPAAGAAVSVTYDRTDLEAGGTVRVRAVVVNSSPEPVQMPLIDLGTPPGFTVDPAGLETLKADGRIARYSITPRGVIVYLTGLAGGERLAITYSMTARMPLKAVSPPSRAYTYYDPDQTACASPVLFTVD